MNKKIEKAMARLGEQWKLAEEEFIRDTPDLRGYLVMKGFNCHHTGKITVMCYNQVILHEMCLNRKHVGTTKDAQKHIFSLLWYLFRDICFCKFCEETVELYEEVIDIYDEIPIEKIGFAGIPCCSECPYVYDLKNKFSNTFNHLDNDILISLHRFKSWSSCNKDEK